MIKINNKLKKIIPLSVFASLSLSSSLYLATSVNAQEGGITVGYINTNLSNPTGNEDFWKKVKVLNVPLLSQPMVIPQSKKTETSVIKVQAVHNKNMITFRLNWKDAEKSEGGPLGKFSDGVAIEFPTGSNTTPPSAFMGEIGKPVHIYHWKDAFQYDKDHGKMKTVKDIYPNASIDMYPLEAKPENREEMKSVKENYPKATEAQKTVFVHGQAAGNPQSSPKLKAVDEIFAEGWGTSQVINNHEAIGNGKWVKGEWTVVITRPLKAKVGSKLEIGKSSFICFAVWQGGKDEVGSRKSVTLSWLPLYLSK